MKGLIIKDLLCLKSQMKSLFIIVIGFIIISAINKDYSLVAFVVPFYVVMILVSTFSYDEFNNFNGYCNTFPLTRKQIVISKYALVFMGVLISAVVGLLISFGINLVDKGLRIEELIATLAGGIFGITIVISLLIPFFYKYGIQKGRMMLFALFIGVSLVGGILIKALNSMNVNLELFFAKLDSIGTIPIILISVFIMCFILIVSYLVSCHVYEHKEF